MMNMKKIDPKLIADNAIELIGDKWMLVTAGTMECFNTMTANWGGLGYIWRKPAAFVFIRPNRYTYEFTEKNSYFTLSFMSSEYKSALAICGKYSGRDVNKMEKAGLKGFETHHGSVAIEGADLVLECRKMYADMLNPEGFIDKTILSGWYDDKDQLPHKMYVVEIVGAWVKE